MGNIMSCCGTICSDCNALKATVNNDNTLRQETAELWSKLYQADIKAEDVNCLGCKSDTVIGYGAICAVRKCTTQKGVETCSGCDSFGCEKLEEIFKHAPDNRSRLEQSRK